MSSMITDPVAIQKFRNQLLDLVDELQAQAKRTDAAIDEVANTWKDEEFKKYRREFDQDRELFDPLCKDIEAFESEPLYQLQKKAEIYLGENY